MKIISPQLIVRGVHSIVAGLGPEGQNFGELVPTSELLEHMQLLIPGSDKRLSTAWVAEHLGIQSVAITTDTLKVCRRIWETTPGHNVESAFTVSQSEYNLTIYAMLQQAVGRTVSHVTAHRPDARITVHIHICGGSHQFIEPELNTIRRKTGIADPAVCTIILQQGCAGILVALDLANTLLENGPTVNHALITAESNMLFTTHLRSRHTPTTNQDYNYWLWPAIFGEGVGAMVVGRPDNATLTTAPDWSVVALGYEVTTCDSPVVGPVYNENGLGFNVRLLARQVRENYMRDVTKHAIEVLRLIGGPKYLHRLCLHESNPLLVQKVAAQLEVPPHRVPTVSSVAGTLACVSAFTLLEKALEHKPSGCESQVGCSLIGESGGHLLSGYLRLSPN